MDNVNVTLNNSNLSQFVNSLRDELKDTKETEDTTNLTLTQEEFFVKMREHKDGEAFIKLLFDNGEVRITTRMGLMTFNNMNQILVPAWNNLVAHLEICHSVFK